MSLCLQALRVVTDLAYEVDVARDGQQGSFVLSVENREGIDLVVPPEALFHFASGADTSPICAAIAALHSARRALRAAPATEEVRFEEQLVATLSIPVYNSESNAHVVVTKPEGNHDVLQPGDRCMVNIGVTRDSKLEIRLDFLGGALVIYSPSRKTLVR